LDSCPTGHESNSVLSQGVFLSFWQTVPIIGWCRSSAFGEDAGLNNLQPFKQMSPKNGSSVTLVGSIGVDHRPLVTQLFPQSGFYFQNLCLIKNIYENAPGGRSAKPTGTPANLHCVVASSKEMFKLNGENELGFFPV
jgi:hypothetical protein